MSGYYYLLPQPASAGRKKRVFIFTFYGCTNEEEERQFGIFALKVKSSTCFCQRTLWWEKLMIREKALQLDKVFLVTKRGPCRFPPLCTMYTVDENCEQMSHLKKNHSKNIRQITTVFMKNCTIVIWRTFWTKSFQLSNSKNNRKVAMLLFNLGRIWETLCCTILIWRTFWTKYVQSLYLKIIRQNTTFSMTHLSIE